MPWSTPTDIRSQVQRWWDRGEVLAELAGTESRFPRPLKLKAPTSRELLDRFDEARRWTAQLQQLDWLQLDWREFRHPVFGQNALPAAASIATRDEALRLIGKQREAHRFANLVEQTRTRCPALLDWLRKRPLVALEHADDWPTLLALVDWVAAHPRPMIPLRQLDLPGVHTKFVERHRKLLAELWDLAVPQALVDPAAGSGAGFARRYGFRDLPQRIRFRPLDRTLALFPGDGLQDLKLDLESLAVLPLSPQRVLIVENEVTYLALPALPDTLAIFGAGYGLAVLAQLPWLHGCVIDYWGDLDTHGFVILDELRAVLPQTRSLLMDRATLLAHEPLWVREPSPSRRDLIHLTRDEAELYDDLRLDRLGSAVRLEQELVGFGWVLRRLQQSERSGSVA